MAETSTEAAVDQLHQMFSDHDKSVLEAMLEANGGNVERTVEGLLGNTSNASNGGEGSGAGASSSTDHDAALALQLSREWGEDPSSAPPPPTIPAGIPTPYSRMAVPSTGPGTGVRGGGGRAGDGVFAAGGPGAGAGTAQGSTFSSSSSNISSNSRRGRRVALPDGFLRVPGWNAGSQESSDPQIAADARLAMMLQNQSFQRELQAYPELAYLGRPVGAGTSTRERAPGPSIKEQLTVMGNDVRRKLDELAIRWKMKEPGRAEDATGYSSVPLMSSQGDEDDQAEVVHFAQDSATRRSHGASGGGGNWFRAESSGEEQLADPRHSKKDR